MLTPRKIEKLWAEAQGDCSAKCHVDIFHRERFARLVEAAALEKEASSGARKIASEGEFWRDYANVLRSKARAARKAAEENDDAD